MTDKPQLPGPEPNDEARMTFTEHLAELRDRIMRAGVAVLLGMLACYALSNELFDLIRYPLKGLEDSWVALSPMEPILVKLKIAAYGGLLLTSPYVVYQLCAFIFPGLTPTERKVIRILLVGGSVLAVAGVCVAYFGVFPLIIPYLINTLTPEGVINQLRMNETIGFIAKALAAFGIAFQFPLAVLILVYMDLLTPETLKAYRKVAIVGMAAGAAMLTPPDPGSMLIMLAPLVVMYEGSILASYLVVRRRDRDRAAEAEPKAGKKGASGEAPQTPPEESEEPEDDDPKQIDYED